METPDKRVDQAKPNAFAILMSSTQTKRKKSTSLEAEYATRCPYCTKFLADRDFDAHVAQCASLRDPFASQSPPQPTNVVAGNLNSFLGLKPEDLILPTHFHLHVNLSNTPEQRPHILSSFLFEPLKEVRYTQICNWRAEKRDLILTSNVQFTKPVIESFTNNASVVPLLKSHLQKSIRRSQPVEAVKTSACLMKRDPISLIRRLGIIAVEDVLLNPKEFVTLTWFLLAVSKVDIGTPLAGSSWMNGWIHAYVESLAKCPVYDSETSFTDPAEQLKLGSVRNQDAGLRNVLYALMLRKSFGGSTGDTNLLHNVAQLWLERKTHLQHPRLVPVMPYTEKQLGLLAAQKDLVQTPQAWQLAAVDFHVHRGIVDKIREKMLDEDWEEIGGQDGFNRWMWKFSSGITDKQPWPSSEEMEQWTWQHDDLMVYPCKPHDAVETAKMQAIWNKYANEIHTKQFLILKARLQSDRNQASNSSRSASGTPSG